MDKPAFCERFLVDYEYSEGIIYNNGWMDGCGRID